MPATATRSSYGPRFRRSTAPFRARRASAGRTVGTVAEIYRSADGRWSIERAVDRYLIYDEDAADPTEEVWPCRTTADVYAWMDANGLSPADFGETS